MNFVPMQPPQAAAAIAHRFSRQVAVVTGAGSGIGRATAIRLAAEGAKLALIDANESAVLSTCRFIRNADGVAVSYVADVSDTAGLTEIHLRILADLGVPTVLANIAGLAHPSHGHGLEQVGHESWNQALAVNLTGPYLLSRLLLPGMVELGCGAIVNVSSLAGRSKSATATAAYTASKAGLLGLTRHLAFDYGPLGIRTNAICPGAVDTPMLRAGTIEDPASPEDAERRRLTTMAHAFFMPIRRMSTPEEQAAVILFLASADASYINGVALDVNGGSYMA
ncbi:MAG: SDR family oxidoreductase [Pseudomonadota bacterium]